MDTLSAYIRGRTAAAQGAKQRVFDWVKAATIIAKRKPSEASAGLIEDWEWTGGEIWRDGKPVPEDDTYVYLSSNWATPTLIVDGEAIECWTFDGDSTAKTYWPESALAIVNGKR